MAGDDLEDDDSNLYELLPPTERLLVMKLRHGLQSCLINHRALDTIGLAYSELQDEIQRKKEEQEERIKLVTML